MMRMTFFWTPDLGEFFFKGLEINSVTSLAILCVVLTLFSVLYEAIKVYSACARARVAREQIAAVSCAPSESANLLISDRNNQNSYSKRFCRLINETITFFFHNSVGYALMLGVMVYSGWIFVAVILGMGFGYFFFGHVSMRINMESIQARTTRVMCSQTYAEGGSSENSSKTPSPARTVPYQQGAVSPAVPCHENNVVCEAEVTNECHDKTEVAPSQTADANEDCCCRL